MGPGALWESGIKLPETTYRLASPCRAAPTQIEPDPDYAVTLSQRSDLANIPYLRRLGLGRVKGIKGIKGVTIRETRPRKSNYNLYILIPEKPGNNFHLRWI